MRLPLFAPALTLAAAPALACSPMPFTPSEMPEVGEACAFVTYLTEYRAVGLSEILVTAGGLYRQDIFDGNGCYWEANLLIQDCAAGQMLVIGPDMRDLMHEPRETGIDRIVARIDVESLTLDQIADLARSEDYETRLRLDAGARLSVNGQGLPTRCGCETFSPPSAGN